MEQLIDNDTYEELCECILDSSSNYNAVIMKDVSPDDNLAPYFALMRQLQNDLLVKVSWTFFLSPETTNINGQLTIRKGDDE